MIKGHLITFEGSEGSGKSTQLSLAYDWLKGTKHKAMILREPGGVRISEKIREILLDVANKEMGKECETLLYMAARAQLVAEVIEPALKKGRIILCDRFLDSTVVYQGCGHGVDTGFIQEAGTFATRGIKPRLTFLFDMNAGKGLSRIKRAKDRIERRSLAYHERVRRGYLDLARREPQRVKVIDAEKSREDIQQFVRQHIEQLLRRGKS